MNIRHLNVRHLLVLALAVLSFASCTQKKFHVSGTIADAKDSLLYFENMGLNGPVTVDSVKLGADGSFSFDEKAPKNPEFYRLRIANQLINVAIDSTEDVKIKASYPTMSYKYDVQGSEECSKIKELALMQMNLQTQLNAIANNPNISYDQEGPLMQAALEKYKRRSRSTISSRRR
jgi:hypothetical protein